MTTNPSKEQQAKHEAAESPGRDDVHEQREEAQPREGVVKPSGSPREQGKSNAS